MLNTEARERRQDVVLHYYKEFTSTLKKIGYLGKVPTLLDLNLELLQNGDLGKFNRFLSYFWSIQSEFSPE